MNAINWSIAWAAVMFCVGTVQAGPAQPEPRPGQILVNSIGMKLAYIPAGLFRMGSGLDEPGRYDDETPHRVRLSRGYYMAVTEVTQAQFEKVMGHNPSTLKGADLPVTHVPWAQAVAFCEKLSGLEGRRYHLPTEAQWEYACRAGQTGPVSDDQRNAIAWHLGNSEEKLHPVGRKKPNAWGLYDMLGNVMEWCCDWYGPYPEQPATDPAGPPEGRRRVVRGGSWSSRPRACRPAARACYAPSYQLPQLGFRVVLDPLPPADAPPPHPSPAKE